MENVYACENMYVYTMYMQIEKNKKMWNKRRYVLEYELNFEDVMVKKNPMSSYIWAVSLFNNISEFVSYLMPKPS